VAAGHKDIVLCDPDQRRIQAIPSETGLALPAFNDYNEALAKAEPATVLVCTPPTLHVRQALQAVQAGAHVFIEKPLSSVPDGVPELIREASHLGRVCQVGYNLRFHVGVRKVKELLDANAVGPVCYAQVTMGQYLPDWRPWQDYRQSYTARRELGGGIILDASHELDYLLWLMGRPDSVFCSSDRIGKLDVDVEDSATILLRYASGARADVHMDFVRRDYARGCSLCGEDGTIVWDYPAQTVRLYHSSAREWQTFACECDPNDMYRAEIAHFLECIRNQSSPLNGLEQGLAVLRLIAAARKSADQGAWEVVSW
jgi:predicted dehydrogenase